MTFDEVVSRLAGAKARGDDQAMARCPVHDDKTQSLSVGRGAEGRILMHCHAGCPTAAIVAALGLEASDLFESGAAMPHVVAPAIRLPRPAAATETVYDYTDASGVLLHQVVRGADKSFRQRRPDGTGGWIWRSSGQRAPYRWPELKGHETVWVCEGEKDVDTLWAGTPPIPATTNAGGAGNFQAAEARALLEAGVRTVCVVPDNDIPGRTHADQVIAACRAVGIGTALVVLEGLAPHGDVTDWLADPDHAPALLLERGAAALAEAATTPPTGALDVPPPVPDFLTSPTVFTRISEGRYRLAFDTLGVTFEAAHLRRERQRDLHGELRVRTSLLGARTVGDLLSSSNMNFSSQQSRQRMATFLAGRSGAQLDWLGALEMLCFRVTEAEEAGSPIQPLSNYGLPRPTDSWAVAGIPILQDHPMVLFGDAGSAKSMIALYIGMTLAQKNIKVLLADWEFAPEDHRERLGRLAGAQMPTDTLHYVRCVGPLVQEQARLAAHVQAHGIQYLIVDSIGFAVPGRPEEAEHANSFYRALRSIGIGSLNLAHTSKNAETGQNSPFGSVFWGAGARSLWHLKRSPGPSPDPRVLEIALTHKKSNTGALLPSLGIRLVFGESDTRVMPFNLADSEMSDVLPIWQRIRSAVALEGRTVKDLAAELDEKPETVARTVRRMEIFRRDDRDLVQLAHGREEIIL